MKQYQANINTKKKVRMSPRNSRAADRSRASFAASKKASDIRRDQMKTLRNAPKKSVAKRSSRPV